MRCYPTANTESAACGAALSYILFNGEICAMGIARKNSAKALKIGCLAVFVILLTIYYIYHQNTQLVASDNCSMFQIMIDFLQGNYLMKNWVVGTASFAFTDTIWCLPGLLMGVHVPKIMSFCGALFHAGFVAVVLYLTLRDEIEKGSIKNCTMAFFASAIYLMLIAVVPYSGYTMENPTYLYLNLNLHAGAFMFIAIEIMILYLWWKNDYKGKVYPIIFTVYGILGQMSDGTPLMIFFGPLCVYCAYYLVWPNVDKNNKKNVFLIADSILIVVAAAAINKLITLIGGLKILGVNYALNTPGIAFRNAKLLVIRLLNLLGYDTKYGISITPYVVVVSLIIVLISLSVLFQLFMALKSKPDRLGLLLSLGIVSNVMGVLFIWSGYDTVSARHIMSIPFFGAALVVKFILYFTDKKRFATKMLVVFVLSISLFYAAYNIVKVKDLPNYNADGEAVAAYINEKGGGTGYGALWIYTTISAYTDFESTIIPIRWDGWGVGFYRHYLLINTEWYNESGIHYVVLQSNEGDLYSAGGNRTDFLKFAGEPDEDMVFGIYEVMYYEQDLSQYDLGTTY